MKATWIYAMICLGQLFIKVSSDNHILGGEKMEFNFITSFNRNGNCGLVLFEWNSDCCVKQDTGRTDRRIIRRNEALKTGDKLTSLYVTKESIITQHLFYS